MKSFFVLSLLAAVVHSQSQCGEVGSHCTQLTKLSGLQNCVGAATCTTGEPYCAPCNKIDSASPAFSLAQPLVSECIFQFAHFCTTNLDVGSNTFVCQPQLADGSAAPCAAMFVKYDNIDDLVASPEFTNCKSVANANCLGYTTHPFCAQGGVSIADPTQFLNTLETTCSFAVRSIRTVFTFADPMHQLTWATLNTSLVNNLNQYIGVPAGSTLFLPVGGPVATSADGTVFTQTVDILSGVAGKTPQGTQNFIVALIRDPTSSFHNGNVTKYLDSSDPVEFSSLYPELTAAQTSPQLTDAQKAGIVAGVLICILALVGVYQCYAHYTMKDEDDDDDDEEETGDHSPIKPGQQGQGGGLSGGMEDVSINKRGDNQPRSAGLEREPEQQPDEAAANDAVVRWS